MSQERFPPALALIAEDEPLLAQSLKKELSALWPPLSFVHASHGAQALELALENLPQIVFLDIQMPGLSGLEVAAELADHWPAQRPLPAIVFVTAYDEYAVQAFELAALDYVIKPVRSERLKLTLERICPDAGLFINKFATKDIASDDALLAHLRHLLSAARVNTGAAPRARLTRISASRGTQTVFVPIGEVIYFEAADKYVRVLTAAHEYLIRTPIKDLLPQLDPAQFWQIHRGTVVRADAVLSAQRDDAGKLWLQLQDRAEKLAVSRLYQGLFAAM
jgi:DNA-binding LytR/AlgR family response regulator